MSFAFFQFSRIWLQLRKAALISWWYQDINIDGVSELEFAEYDRANIDFCL